MTENGIVWPMTVIGLSFFMNCLIWVYFSPIRSPSVLASNETTENIKRRRLIDTVSISDSDEEIPETKKVVPAKPSRVIEVISSSGSDSEPSSDIWEDDDIFEEVPEFLLTPAASLCAANSNHHNHPSSSSIPLMKGPSGKYLFGGRGGCQASAFPLNPCIISLTFSFPSWVEEVLVLTTQVPNYNKF